VDDDCHRFVLGRHGVLLALSRPGAPLVDGPLAAVQPGRVGYDLMQGIVAAYGGYAPTRPSHERLEAGWRRSDAVAV